MFINIQVLPKMSLNVPTISVKHSKHLPNISGFQNFLLIFPQNTPIISKTFSNSKTLNYCFVFHSISFSR